MAADLRQKAPDMEMEKVSKTLGNLWFILKSALILFLIVFVFLLLNSWTGAFNMDQFYNGLII